MEKSDSQFITGPKQPPLGLLFVILLIGALFGFQLGRWSNRYETVPSITSTVGVEPTSVFSASPTSEVQSGYECVVTGCNGELCVEKSAGKKFSTCIFQKEFRCLVDSRCEVQSMGKCGWTQTPEYLKCLKDLIR